MHTLLLFRAILFIFLGSQEDMTWSEPYENTTLSFREYKVMANCEIIPLEGLYALPLTTSSTTPPTQPPSLSLHLLLSRPLRFLTKTSTPLYTTAIQTLTWRMSACSDFISLAYSSLVFRRADSPWSYKTLLIRQMWRSASLCAALCVPKAELSPPSHKCPCFIWCLLCGRVSAG